MARQGPALHVNSLLVEALRLKATVLAWTDVLPNLAGEGEEGRGQPALAGVAQLQASCNSSYWHNLFNRMSSLKSIMAGFLITLVAPSCLSG